MESDSDRSDFDNSDADPDYQNSSSLSENEENLEVSKIDLQYVFK